MRYSRVTARKPRHNRLSFLLIRAQMSDPINTTDIAAMIRSVIKRPQELPALLRTALDARAARATLMRGRQVLGPSLGLL